MVLVFVFSVFLSHTVGVVPGIPNDSDVKIKLCIWGLTTWSRAYKAGGLPLSCPEAPQNLVFERLPLAK